MTVTSERAYEIQLGPEASATSTIEIVAVGSAQTPASPRRLVHPDAGNFVPISYYLNPERTMNLDNVPMRHPVSSTVMTLGTTKVVRFERNQDDIIITEVWPGDESRASMPSNFLRMLYEYIINPPAFDLFTPTYVQWEPADRNDVTYNVELISLEVGGTTEDEWFDVKEVLAAGGTFNGGDIPNAFDSIDIVKTGLVDREVRLKFLILSEVP
jgi:hypothetical protein